MIQSLWPIFFSIYSTLREFICWASSEKSRGLCVYVNAFCDAVRQTWQSFPGSYKDYKVRGICICRCTSQIHGLAPQESSPGLNKTLHQAVVASMACGQFLRIGSLGSTNSKLLGHLYCAHACLWSPKSSWNGTTDLT